MRDGKGSLAETGFQRLTLNAQHPSQSLSVGHWTFGVAFSYACSQPEVVAAEPDFICVPAAANDCSPLCGGPQCQRREPGRWWQSPASQRVTCDARQHGDIAN